MPRNKSRYFPSVDTCDEDGLLAVGGELSPPWLIDAYSHGIFPWPVVEDPALVAWWSPDPRAIFELDGFHASRRLLRTYRSGRFRVSFDEAFEAVVHGCATAPDRRGGTWITKAIRAAYAELHREGHAHSVEVWQGESLVGGLYGVHIGGLFAGESMFHLVTDASKIALVALVERLKSAGVILFDIQQLTPHTQSLGAIEIPRAQYLERLAGAIAVLVMF